jgi:small subunit ribosomal protein S20
MPNIKSQIKRMHKSEEQRQRNKAVKSALKTDIRKFEAAVQSLDPEAARQMYAEASRSLDKAASKGVIHKNKAANKKSRMFRDLKSLP